MTVSFFVIPNFQGSLFLIQLFVHHAPAYSLSESTYARGLTDHRLISKAFTVFCHVIFIRRQLSELHELFDCFLSFLLKRTWFIQQYSFRVKDLDKRHLSLLLVSRYFSAVSRYISKKALLLGVVVRRSTCVSQP